MDLFNQRIQAANTYIDANKKAVLKAKWRQHYHFMAPVGWLNDPNGLIQWNGEYHLFYQFNPYSAQWDSMYWGHAVSQDLCHWKHLPVALAPSAGYDDYQNGGCFSGSAVQTKEGLTLIYTGCSQSGEDIVQTQCLAVSRDGVRFKKYENNPVITSYPEEGGKDFRDPKVWHHGRKWYLVCGSGKDGIGKALLYRSDDLKNWEFVNVMAESDGTLGYMWECPDYFELDGVGILTFSPMGAGEHQAVYLAGKLDYETGKFTEKFRGDIDRGLDYYAAQSFLDDKGRRIAIGWAGSWEWMPWFRGHGKCQQKGWCGHMSLPREIKLGKDGKLKFIPVRELESLRKEKQSYNRISLDSCKKPINIRAGDGIRAELLLTIDLEKTTAEKMFLDLRKTPENTENDQRKTQKTCLEIDFNTQNIVLNLQKSDGRKGEFCGGTFLEKKILSIRIYLDTCSIEVFTDEYRLAMSANIYPEETACQSSLQATEGKVEIVSLDTYSIEF